MNKAILLSIKPEWLAKILNGEKTIEVRKKFPKDYVGWVYLYCSKDKKFPLVLSSDGESFQEYCNAKYYPPFIRGDVLNGQVVARFWCNKVEEIYWKQDISNPYINDEYELVTNSLKSFELLNKSCLNETELINYLDKDCEGWNVGFAIHISNLEIFDRPRHISEFKKVGYLDKIKSIKVNPNLKDAYKSFEPIYNKQIEKDYALTEVPTNYCYVEEE